MPRDAAGVYSLPAGYKAQPDTTILTSQHNPPLEDIAQALTGSLPRDGAAPMTGPLKLQAGAPTLANEATRKDYVDTLVGKATALNLKNPVGVDLVLTSDDAEAIVWLTDATAQTVTLPANQTSPKPLRFQFYNTSDVPKTIALPAGNYLYYRGGIASSSAPFLLAPRSALLVSGATWDYFAVENRPIGRPQIVSANITLTTAHLDSFIQLNGSSTTTTTIPLAPLIGSLRIWNRSGAVHNVVQAGGASIYDANVVGSATVAVQPGEVILLLSDGASWIIIDRYFVQQGIWPLATIYGLTLSRPTATTVGIAAGGCRNEDTGPGYNMVLSSAITKGLGSWAVGSGNGGLDTGTIAASTWYHVHLIRKGSDGSIDALLSLSATTPTMPSGYTARRRLGSILTNASSQVVAFQQVGNQFIWDVPVVDVSATAPGTAAVTRTLTVPTGVGVEADLIIALMQQAGTATSVWVSPLLITDTPAGTPGGVPLDGPYQVSSLVSGGLWTSSPGRVRTNMSAQVRSRLSASGASIRFGLVTLGWFDARGGN